MQARHGFAVAALIAAWPVSPATGGPQGQAVLTGLVYDSTGFGALGGVTVSLGGNAALTDSVGRYRLTGLSLGRVQVRFEHPRLGLLLGDVVADVELRSDSTEFNLLVGAATASHGTMCGSGSVRGAPAAGFFGTVWLGGTDTALTGAEVAASWPDSSGQRRAVLVRADQLGVYRLCGVPAGVTAVVAARGGGRESPTQELVLEPDEMMTRNFIVGGPIAMETGSTSIGGRVLVHGTGEPIPNTEVLLLQSGWKTVTSPDGSFTLTKMATGKQTLMVRRIGFRTLYREITVRAGQSVLTNYALEPSGVRLPTVAVNAPTVSSWKQDFDERRVRGFGTFFDETALRRFEGRTLDAMMRTIDNVRLVQTGYGRYAQYSAFNKRNDGRRDHSQCPYAVVLDGQVTYAKDGVAERGNDPPDLRTLVDIVSLKGIEVYDGPAETPEEFVRFGSNCGVIVLWTKSSK
ncbi:MAG: hypothetical protein HOP28_10060 [Gemmatimonadales bacterium]|nr:hypothetical protein [Gemmatimonadales bacterium]